MPKDQGAGDETGPFVIGEKVMVPHVDKFYEAKVLKAEFRNQDKQWHYLVHYTGWNKKWDEWVEQTGLKKLTDIDPKAPVFNPNRKFAATDGPSAAGTAPSKKRRLEDAPAGGNVVAPGVPQQITIHLELEIPAILKKQIVDDYEIITHQNKLVPLPRQPCVAELLQLYVEQVKEQRGTADLEDEVAQGLRKYFDKALVLCLLYNCERDQSKKVVASGKLPSEVYGAEHFLRLFVKLPELLPQSEATDDQLVLLRVHLNDVLSFLKTNQDQFFVPASSYSPASKQ